MAWTLTGTTPRYWYDASGLPAGVLSQWNDLSGNNYHLARTGTTRPTVVAAAMNGKSAVFFDVANFQYMDTTVSNSTGMPGSYFSVFAAFQKKTTGSRSLVGQETATASNGTLYWRINGDTGTKVGATWRYFTVPDVTLNKPHHANLIYDGANMYSRMDGAESPAHLAFIGTPVSSGSPFTVGRYGSYGTQYWDGYIGEIILFASAVSDADRVAIQGYLNSKWVLPIASRRSLTGRAGTRGAF